ncbi:hypothetical protein LTR94_035270, partial [Friedmanniomyces endolithicus]
MRLRHAICIPAPIRRCIAIEQQGMDALGGGLEFRAAGALQAELVAIELGPHPARMGRQQQDAVAHHQQAVFVAQHEAFDDDAAAFIHRHAVGGNDVFAGGQ